MSTEKVQQLIEQAVSQIAEHLPGDIGVELLVTWTDGGETYWGRAGRGNQYARVALIQDAASIDHMIAAERASRRAH